MIRLLASSLFLTTLTIPNIILGTKGKLSFVNTQNEDIIRTLLRALRVEIDTISFP